MKKIYLIVKDGKIINYDLDIPSESPEFNIIEYETEEENISFLIPKLRVSNNNEIYTDTHLDSIDELIALKYRQIGELKDRLQSSDWKVTVNSEFRESGLPIKYPDLHAERQLWRGTINTLEEEIEELYKNYL